MCGIAGFLHPFGLSAEVAERNIRKMVQSMVHRGPDDDGVWTDTDAGIAIGHRRLAVLELSAAGHQPMASSSEKYLLAFNGEIYNHLGIRKELEKQGRAIKWRGNSDTETLLAAIETWGIKSALDKTVGMFAIAIWDRQERQLTLARDRLGEKPLYYGWQDGVLLFASELTALRAHGAFSAAIDRDVMASYFRRGYIEAPHSIYKDIYKLLPGTYVQIGASQQSGSELTPEVYWSLRQAAVRGFNEPFIGTDSEAVSELQTQLRRSVALQSVADVPLGAFLSGGIDSSIIVALLQEQSSRPVKSFTIGFTEEEYNEAQHARMVARHLGTEHTELYVSPRQAIEVIPSLPLIYDEPFGDSSAIPTLLVAQLAKQHVTVSLSGDGGDELFAGYQRYQRMTDIWKATRRLPAFSRGPLESGLNFLSKLARKPETVRKANQLSTYFTAQSFAECYQSYLCQWHDAQHLVYGVTPPISTVGLRKLEALDQNPYSEMLYADAMSYLPDDILAKVDRAAMSVSLETRIPMLDHRVVEFAWQLPMHLKIRQGERKWVLKEVLRKYVPDKMIDRPKMGFGVPVGRWLRGPLRDWAESLLSAEKLQAQGFLNPAIVHKEWQHHLKGDGLAADKIWQILMFQAWLAEFGDTA